MALHRVPVDEFTTPTPKTVDLMTPLTDLTTIMADGNFRHIPVLENDRVVGIISDRDLRMFYTLGGGDHVLARDIMVPHPYVARSGTPLDQVALEMSKRKLGSTIIVDDEERAIGIFTSTDALNALIESLRGEIEI